MSNANLERRVERNTNDIEAIYDVLTDHGEQLAAIQAKLSTHDTRFDQIDDRLSTHDTRFDQIDATLSEVLKRLPDPPSR